MKDIKVTKVNSNKNVAKKVVKLENVEKPIKTTVFTQKRLNYFPAILFGFMTTSVLCYVFLISSSIFYAVKTSQYEYKSEKINVTFASSLDVDNYLNKTPSDRISYINQSNSVAISLK